MMQKSSTWILKLGGAMMRAPTLRDWLAPLGTPPAAVRCLVVAGGGGLADAVRELHAAWDFELRLAHDLAIETMGMNARVLAALAPTLPLTSGCVSAALPTGHAIWLPPRPCPDLGLPADWDTTADSIAYALGRALGAERVVLVKSVGPDALDGRSPAALAADGIVDACLPGCVNEGGPALEVTGVAAAAAFARQLKAVAAPSGAA